MTTSHPSRKETRMERYNAKLATAKLMPVHVATINFDDDGNVGFVARACACFGALNLHIVGRMPEPKELRRTSATNSNMVQLHHHRNPLELLQFVWKNQMQLISAELTDNSTDIKDVDFDFGRGIMLVLGQEQTGVPEGILHHSNKVVHVPMNGPGFCMNTAQTGNIFLYEMARRFLR